MTVRSLREPWQLLGLVADGIEEVVNHLGDGKLGYRDLIILCNIAAQPGLTARGLIEATGFDQAQISRILLRFIDAGLIRRLPDPHESRRYRYFIKAGGTARHLLHASNLILERTARGESPAVGQLLLAATRGTPHYRQEIWKQVRVIFASELGEEFSSRKPSTPSLSNAGALAEDAQTAHEDFRVRFMRMIRFLNEWSSDGRNHRHFQLTRR